MPSLNKVFLLGNLTQDPEIIPMPSGKNKVIIRLATSRRVQDPSGEWKDVSTFNDVVCWNHAANHAIKWCARGTAAYVEGHLSTDTWQDKQTGKTRTKLYVTAENLQYTERPKPQPESTAPQSPPRQQHYQQKANGYQPQPPTPSTQDDDIPF